MPKLKLSNKGSVLVGVVATSAILSLVALSSIGLVRNIGSNETTTLNEAKLLSSVESGALLGSALVAREDSWSISNSNLFSSSPLTINGFNVTVSSTPVSTDTIMITSTASTTDGGYSKTISLLLAKGSGGGLFSELKGTGGLSGASLTMTGSAGINMMGLDEPGKIHAWTSANLAWSTFITNGSLEAVQSITMANSNNGIDTATQVDPVPVPELPQVNVAGFISTAQSNNMVFNSMVDAMGTLPPAGPDGIVHIPGGVLYIQGDVHSNSMPWNKRVLGGMVIADGNITMANDRNIINTYSNSFSAISLNGNVTFSGSELTANGGIYAPNGSVAIQNSRHINGNILAKGNISLTGNAASANGMVLSSEGSVTIANSCSVTGQVVAKTGLTLSGNSRLNYYFPSEGYVIEGVTSAGGDGAGAPTIVSLSWTEINQ